MILFWRMADKVCELLSSDISDWKITFADTGLNSNIGQRLRAVEKYVGMTRCFSLITQMD